jgi:transaldolase/glucose-6-phosphate isomerase
MATKTKNPLSQLPDHGQSVWLDYIRRSLITSGELKRLVRNDRLRGVTSNPSIFEKAIVGSTDYKEVLESPAALKLDAQALYEKIAVRDIRRATTVLRPVYEESRKRDGYVSIEVSPLLAHDQQGTLDEARRLWRTVGRANLMVKVPGTVEGIPAIEQLISEGININVTLLFAQEVYEQVALAYIAGLEKFSAGGGDVRGVASVASFFVSRIDTMVDDLLTAKIEAAAPAEQAALRNLPGKAAIANAKQAYQKYLRLFSSPRWQALAAKGAQTQRLLWASTGTKNPNYRDVLYIEELIGRDTVNTIPPATLDAFRDHGRLRESLTEDVAGANDTLAALAKAGIPMKEVTDKLTEDGVRLFADAFTKLLLAVSRYSKESRGT